MGNVFADFSRRLADEAEKLKPEPGVDDYYRGNWHDNPLSAIEDQALPQREERAHYALSSLAEVSATVAERADGVHKVDLATATHMSSLITRALRGGFESPALEGFGTELLSALNTRIARLKE